MSYTCKNHSEHIRIYFVKPKLQKEARQKQYRVLHLH